MPRPYNVRVHRRSMDFGLGDTSFAHEKIEIAALVGLADVRAVHGAIAARIARRRFLPGGAPTVELVLGDMQIDAARSNIVLHLVAAAHDGERADEAFRRHMQDARAIAG